MKKGDKERRIIGIWGLIVVLVVVGAVFGGLPDIAYAAKFNMGDTVEIYNIGGSGLLVRDTPCGNIIGGKFDGDRGMVLDGPAYCNNYNRWLIRWGVDSLEGWSAEDWLKEIYIPPSTKFSIGDAVRVYNTGVSGLSVRTDPPELKYKATVYEGTEGTVEDGPFYGVPKGSTGFYHFGKVDYGGNVGWSAENYLEKATIISARIDSYSPSSKIEVDPGESFTISVDFTNTGNTAWDFLAGASIWDSNGNEIIDDWSGTITLQPGGQGSYSWTHTINTLGEYELQFGIWKDTSTLLDKEPSSPQNLIRVKQPINIDARIDSYSPSSKIEVYPGESFTISVDFTNTGNTAWDFYAGASIWDSNGNVVFDAWSNSINLGINQQGSYSWAVTLNDPGEYYLQFGVWKYKGSTLLDKKPSPYQNLIRVKQPINIDARIDSYSPSSKIEVYPGESFTISVDFTNTGNTAWDFYAGASIWDSNGNVVFDAWSNSINLGINQQGSYSWAVTLNDPGEYYLQFGVWKYKGSTLLDKKPSPYQNLIRVKQPINIDARIDSYSPSSKIEVYPGESFTISVDFTNTGNTAWDFLAGASIWDSNGNEIIDDWSGTITLQSGEQGSYSWTHTINTPGEYELQFGIWKDTSTLLDKEPSSPQNLIRVKQPINIDARIDSYSPSSKIEVYPGESFTISVDFTNTGNTAWDFLAGASIRDSNGNEIIDDWSGTITLQSGEQGSYSWTHTINTPGEYELQFGIWKDTSTLLDKEPSSPQNLVRVKQPINIDARIDSYSPSSKIEVYPGESFTISVDFTNTGNTAWDFLAGASIWDSNGNEIIDDWSGTITLQPGGQGSYSWTHTINTPGEYELQFGIWKDTSTLLDKEPSSPQNLIRVKQPINIDARIDSYSPSSKIEVYPGESFTISVDFTNTGNTAWDFLAGASIWDSNGNEIIDDWSGTITLQSGEQGSYSWTHTINTPGEYELQFGIWKDTSTLLDKEPSSPQNLIRVKQPINIDARIDSYSPSSKIEVYPGESFTISVDFTNTGNTAWDFLAGASIWDSNGNEIIDDWSGTITLQPGGQGSYSWTHTINTPGEYELQFGIWKDTSTLLDKEPSSPQNLIRVKQPINIDARIDSYSPSSKIEVYPGESFTISVDFTNTGNTAWDFLAGASIWDSNGNEIIDDWSGTITLQPGGQGSYSWTHTINTPGEYELQFGIWKDTSTLLDKEPSSPQNLIRVKQPINIDARIDSYSPSSKIEVYPGESFTISVDFTNTGNTAWDFLAGASIWDSNGNEIIDDWSGTITLQSGEQGSYSWTHTINTPGEYELQFGIWKDTSTLLDKEPSSPQNLIKVKQETPPENTINFYTIPPSVGSITFSGTTYTHGESGKYSSGTYSISANLPSGYDFKSWSTSGEILVASSTSSSTTATINGDGSLTANFESSPSIEYNRPSAYNYSQKYAYNVCSDGYFFEASYPPSYLGAETPVPSECGFDCAHFVSCCIGAETHEQGGGLDVPSRTEAYGEPGADKLRKWLIDSGNAMYETTIGELEKGDVISYDWEGDGYFDHVVLYLDSGKIAAHSVSYWNANWDVYKQNHPNFNYKLIHIKGGEQQLTCAIELQKNGIPIDKVNVGQFFDIYVGDSSGRIAQVRFLSDENQNDIVDEGFNWTEWYNWDISSGDWNAETKIMRWAFHTEGSKEVWVEVKDDDGQTSNCSANIYANPQIPTPEITGIDPSKPIACSGKQWLTITGSGFDSNSEVTFSIGSDTYLIPEDRTWFIDSNKIEVLVGLTKGTWKIWITNLGGIQSDPYTFQASDFSIEDGKKVASLALQYWNKEDAINMTAIAAAESCWNPNVGGDYGISNFNCCGYASWGLWQIYMDVHKDKLEKLGAPIDDPCETAKWLSDPNNNVKAAYEVWKVQGFEAWSTYNNGKYKDYLDNAKEAVEALAVSANIEVSKTSAKSGEQLTFDGSGSEGPIDSYKWDFDDGTIVEGSGKPSVEIHRFIGSMNQPKTYHVSLTVQDNIGDTDSTVLDVTVMPLEKTLEVSYHPPIPIPDQPVFARMTVLYNWINDNEYVVTKIHYESEGFLGVGTISVWDMHSAIWHPIWADNILSWGTNREETYYPKLSTVHYGGDTFEGIVVDAFDAMNIYIEGYAGIEISTGPFIPPPFFKTNSACFEPDYTQVPDVPIEAPNLDLSHLCSPGVITVYDSQGRVTGLLNGTIKEEIPNSIYDTETKTVLICFSNDSYRYKIIGTDIGTYGLTINSVEEGEADTFGVANVSTTNKTTHQYTINWSTQEATVQIDSDGDGTFEQNITLQPPVASFTYTPENPTVNQAITFNASSSYDPDGNITNYEWNFGDGTNGSGRITTHSYSSAGEYPVTLIITDNSSTLNSTTKIITIPDTTPPKSITNLMNTTGQTWINWTWTNPPDADFNYTVVYLNGTWKINTSDPYYNATGINSNTFYEIGTHTVDKVGNVNATWVNQTAATISPCFIATAAYGTALHGDIDVLRDFRDEYLMPNPAGRTFVKIYYNTSPPLAEVIRGNEWLRTAVREGLVKPLVHITGMFVG